MPKAQTMTYADVFASVLKIYQEAADKSFAVNPDKEYVLKMMKNHARELTRTGGPDGIPLFSGNCPGGWVQCSNGDCVPILLGC
ncbi:MAG TPA: hypothetical protein PLD20_07900 [Blastocatellia bacterium]|nr:hypothetical protein [Blastocatellia bacterium]HMV85664.1 hypothetical protein [Blastocatellia bacterium]HMX26423.1 hypothetical protein [Blastocatellia bacterium]HMY70825.1 hypothetical protein [Blastocatellia bacterium]HMZ17836.1 hypothetical protein [Blastocatellia bacterium]